jgi:hypothetical protein
LLRNNIFAALLAPMSAARSRIPAGFHACLWRGHRPGPEIFELLAVGGQERSEHSLPERHAAERRSFVWGGRWYHYDTMHFEYRPELVHSSD